MPRYVHDCAKCNYLGSGSYTDWYHCPSPTGGSLVGRYGAEGSQYWSAPIGMLAQILNIQEKEK